MEPTAHADLRAAVLAAREAIRGECVPFDLPARRLIPIAKCLRGFELTSCFMRAIAVDRKNYAVRRSACHALATDACVTAAKPIRDESPRFPAWSVPLASGFNGLSCRLRGHAAAPSVSFRGAAHTPVHAHIRTGRRCNASIRARRPWQCERGGVAQAVQTLPCGEHCGSSSVGR